MTDEEAIEVLKADGYVPGRHRTYGMEPDRVTRITAAVNALKESGALIAAILELGAPPKRTTKKRPAPPVEDSWPKQ